MTRELLPAIGDILEAIEGIERAIAGKTFADFEADWLLRRGVERAIEIISEASRRIPRELRSKRPEIPWRDVETIGNILRHEYHTISNPIIWDVVQNDLPALKAAVEAIAGGAQVSTGPDDLRFMQLALTLGRRGLGNTWPNPAVGAVAVKDGVVIGRGWTQPGGRPHAETEALRRAGERARGATLYVTLEPCSHHGRTPPCTDAIVAAGIARVVSALSDPNPQVAGDGYARLRAAGIAVTDGLCAEEARRDHAGHIRCILDGRPHVTLKLAVSADGKAALAGGRPVRITGEAARARVHLMRAMNDAIMVGIGTVLADDPALTSRLPGMLKASPVRVVLDPVLRLPVTSRLAASAREIPVWVFCAPDASHDRERSLSGRGVIVTRIEAGEGGLALPAVLHALAERGITRLMVEGGPKVAASFLRADLVDEAVLLHGPAAIGPDGVPALDGLPLDAITASPGLRLAWTETIGDDRLERYERR
jgi:diaminohydroxyphosphoribosylaminopyrimidine deaminase/5-amino-6-(5-phosphoribosylamino)uracil reductase